MAFGESGLSENGAESLKILEDTLLMVTAIDTSGGSDVESRRLTARDCQSEVEMAAEARARFLQERNF
jgi:hypothetical protein